MDGIAVAGEVAGAGTALAGLILVYLGALVTGFEGFQPQERRSNKPRFTKRAWIAFAGVILALLSALCGIAGKGLPSPCIANVGVVLLLLSFIWGGFIAYLTVREID